MSVHNLDSIFRPKHVAVIGATERVGSVGHALMQNLIDERYAGTVYPVNPKRETVAGLRAYPSIAALPEAPDLAVICTPGPTVASLVAECGEAGVGGIVTLTAGFGETGEAGRRQQKALYEELRRHDGLRMVGPNCLGVIVPPVGLNASFAAAMPKPGNLAFISQSGALCTAVLDWALQEEIGFSHFISIGNMMDVDFGDLIDYLGADAGTSALLLYVESIQHSRKFLSAARAFARSKPIVALKSGRFGAAAAAAASHTGAMAGEDTVYDAAFRRAGIRRVNDLSDLFDCAELLSHHRPSEGSRLAIVTNAGGPGVIATDALVARGGALAEPSAETMAKLDAMLPPHWSHGNPFDVLGDAPPERLAGALKVLLGDPGIDAALVVLAPQAMTDPTETARAIVEVARGSRKSVLAAWMGGRSMQAGIDVFNEAGIAAYRNVEDSVDAFMHLVAYAHNLDVLHETPRDTPVEMPVNRAEARARIDAAAGADRLILQEGDSKALVEAYGITVTNTASAHSADEAVAAANRLGHPVVLKVLSPQITHKTDVDGVALNLKNDAEVHAAYGRIVIAARMARPDATVEGVTVQPMLSDPHGVELIIGMRRDATFGASIMIGAGGTAAEIFKDRAVELPPLNERLARRMIESLRVYPLLVGHRGRPGVNVDRLIETLIRFSYLVADNPAVAELDLNPVLATPDCLIALDARVVLERGQTATPAEPYPHLAIRPYPQDFVTKVELRDGTPILLRPIMPEDVPRWHDLLVRCSPDSIWFRFGRLISKTTHSMAARYCFVDYDREMAIVAEVASRDQRQLIAVGRLSADVTRETAEYAILVADAWQGKGLGSQLTDYCLEVARRWGLKRVVAQTHPQNQRMIKIFSERGFSVKHDHDEGAVFTTLELGEASETLETTSAATP